MALCSVGVGSMANDGGEEGRDCDLRRMREEENNPNLDHKGKYSTGGHKVTASDE